MWSSGNGQASGDSDTRQELARSVESKGPCKKCRNAVLLESCSEREKVCRLCYEPCCADCLERHCGCESQDLAFSMLGELSVIDSAAQNAAWNVSLSSQASEAQQCSTTLFDELSVGTGTTPTASDAAQGADCDYVAVLGSRLANAMTLVENMETLLEDKHQRLAAATKAAGEQLAAELSSAMRSTVEKHDEMRRTKSVELKHVKTQLGALCRRSLGCRQPEQTGVALAEFSQVVSEIFQILNLPKSELHIESIKTLFSEFEVAPRDWASLELNRLFSDLLNVTKPAPVASCAPLASNRRESKPEVVRRAVTQAVPNPPFIITNNPNWSANPPVWSVPPFGSPPAPSSIELQLASIVRNADENARRWLAEASPGSSRAPTLPHNANVRLNWQNSIAFARSALKTPHCPTANLLDSLPLTNSATSKVNSTRSKQSSRTRLPRSTTDTDLDQPLAAQLDPALCLRPAFSLPPTRAKSQSPAQAQPQSNQPPKVLLARSQVLYHAKFGAFGVSEGSFSEPGGLCVNLHGDIVVADTNNHRIQVFTKDGAMKFQFGESGKMVGQFMYPNRVACNPISGEYVITERAPTNKVLMFTQDGQFVRHFGQNKLRHPRGVCVDIEQRIFVLECKIMKVLIFSALDGELNGELDLSEHLSFPNAIACNQQQRLFISDNRLHCVKVFDYSGAYVCCIGGEGYTNYPIGVAINSRQEIVVCDNHNNFNITVYCPEGKQIRAQLESRVKHAQCFNIALVNDSTLSAIRCKTGDGTNTDDRVVVTSKDFRVYSYKYNDAAAKKLE